MIIPHSVTTWHVLTTLSTYEQEKRFANRWLKMLTSINVYGSGWADRMVTWVVERDLSSAEVHVIKTWLLKQASVVDVMHSEPHPWDLGLSSTEVELIRQYCDGETTLQEAVVRFQEQGGLDKN